MNSQSEPEQMQQIARKIYQFMISDHSPSSNQILGVDANPASWGLDINDWEWNPGVGVISILEYYKISRSPDVLDYLISWVKKNRHKASKYQHVNRMTPFAIFPDLYRFTGDPYFLETADDYVHWIVKNLIRTMTGAIQHGGNLTEEIWADTIFMVVLFISRMARLTNDKSLAEEALQQLLLHLQYLQDHESGVLFHGYYCHLKGHESAARWTRGNAWITLGTPLILTEVKDILKIPEEILTRYQRLVEGLIKFQASNGLWHTVMDHPNFYQETSGSAGIACGILRACKMGLIPEQPYIPVINRAVNGVISKVNSQGMVDGVSGGTPIMKTIDEYNQLTQYPTLYGQGLALMLLAGYAAQV